jgi:cytochrome P450
VESHYWKSNFHFFHVTFCIIHFSRNPEEIKQILVTKSKRFQKSPEVSNVASSLFGDTNVFSSTGGEDWKRHRTLSNPAFSDSNLISIFSSHIIPQIQTFKNYVKENISKGTNEVNLTNAFACLTFDIIANAGFGFDSSTLTSGDTKLLDYSNALLGSINTLIAVPPFMRKWILKLGIGNYWIDFITNMVNSREKEVNQLKDEFDKNDLLSQLITARDENAKLSTSELISNAGVFMIAGHETTSNTLQWSLFYIACNPEVQLKVQKECDSFNFSDKSSWEEYSTHFQYIKCVMNEALRLKTPAFLQIRNSLEDVFLDDFFIPKGVMKIILI